MRASYVLFCAAIAGCGKAVGPSSTPGAPAPPEAAAPAVLVLDLPPGIEATVDGVAASGRTNVEPGAPHVVVLASTCDRSETTIELAAGEIYVADPGPLLGRVEVEITDEHGTPRDGALTLEGTGRHIAAVSGQPLSLPACPTRMTVSAPDRGKLSVDLTPVAGATTRIVAPLAGGSNMVRIPGGTYTMGPPLHALFRWAAVPRFEALAVEPFDLDRSEVTAEQYLSCVQEGRCRPTARNFGSRAYPEHCTLVWTRGTVSPKGEPNRPATCLDAAAATEYCSALGKRLITDVEWEFVARNGGTTDYPWGDEPPDCSRGRVEKDCRGVEGTAPPCSHPAGNSPLGICDLYGNVSEMTSPVLFEGRFTGHVVRGGYWHEQDPMFVKSHSDAPEGHVGFRCARSLGPDEGSPPRVGAKVEAGGIHSPVP